MRRVPRASQQHYRPSGSTPIEYLQLHTLFERVRNAPCVSMGLARMRALARTRAYHIRKADNSVAGAKPTHLRLITFTSVRIALLCRGAQFRRALAEVPWPDGGDA